MFSTGSLAYNDSELIKQKELFSQQKHLIASVSSHNQFCNSKPKLRQQSFFFADLRWKFCSTFERGRKTFEFH
jgi:hypothetical protein